MSVTVVIEDNATPALEKLADSLTPQRLAAVVGPACARLTQRHLQRNGTNRRGWPTTNFWSRAAQATSWSAEGDGVAIHIDQTGVRQRVEGGMILPVGAQALAIPISPLSYGRRPADFPGLFLMKTRKGAYLVQSGDGGSRKNAPLNFLFQLSGGVDQPADPDLLPSEEEYHETATAAIDEAVAEATGEDQP